LLKFTLMESDIKEAEYRSQLAGTMSASRFEGRGNVIGFLGEIITARYTGGEIVDTYDYDIQVKDLKVDVKTKAVSTPPRGHYLCSVMEYQLGNDSDVYVFVRINLTNKTAWLLGSIAKSRLLAEGLVQRRGDLDGDWEVKEDCRSIRIDQLDHIATLSCVEDTREKF